MPAQHKAETKTVLNKKVFIGNNHEFFYCEFFICTIIKLNVHFHGDASVKEYL